MSSLLTLFSTPWLLSLTITGTNDSSKDDVLYNVNYGASSDFFVASVGEVASIVISTTEAEINTPTKIDFALYDENGKDVTSAVDVDAHCTVTFTGDYNDYSNTKASNTTVTMVTKDAECEVTVEYNKNDGETEPVTQIGKITCVAASEKSGNKFFKMVKNGVPDSSEINDRSEAFRFYALSADDMVKVEVDKTQLVHFYAQDPTDKSAISYDSYEIKSADETIANVTIGKATGKWASFTVEGNQVGPVLLTLTATKNGASTEYTIPVTVTQKAVVARVKLSFEDTNGNTTRMSNTWDALYSGDFDMSVVDSNGDAANDATYKSEGFKIITENKTIDSDLKKAGYEAYQEAYAEKVAGFRFKGETGATTGEVTAYAAEGGSYTVEGSVSDLTTGKIISGRMTITVDELPKEAWVVDPDEEDFYGPDAFEDTETEGIDDVTGLTEAKKAAIEPISATAYAFLKEFTVRPGFIDKNAAEPTLSEAYGEYASTGALDDDGLLKADKSVLVYYDKTEKEYAVISTADRLLGIAAPEQKKDKATIIKITNPAGGTPFDPTTADAVKNGTTLSDSVLFAEGKAPIYGSKLVFGQDAYDHDTVLFATIPENGADANYAVEMTTSMGYLSNNEKKASLYATMNGTTFAGYVRENGQIGGDKEGNATVLASKKSRIISSEAQKKDIQIQAYFAKEVIGVEEGTTTSLLFGLAKGGTRKPADPVDTEAATAAKTVLSRTFVTTATIGAGDEPFFYTNQLEQIPNDDWFAHEGEYRVEFSYYFMNSSKKQEKITTFKVKRDLYIPTVTVKSQTLESYSQEDWAEAVVSEVDLNNDDPTDYSVLDLVDKEGHTISDAETPAKWAVVTEEGVNFWIPLNRTFKLA